MRFINASLLTSLLILNLYADHDESLDGDLSNDASNPTNITTNIGSNLVSLSSIGGEDDYFTITVPVGSTLSAINLTAFSSSNVGFLAVQNGTSFSASPAIGDLLGFDHINGTLEDKLPILGASSILGTIGFSGPLPEGSYTFWSQETSTSVPTSYTLDFVITGSPVPSLSEWSIIVLSLSLLIFVIASIRASVTNSILGPYTS